MPAHPAATASSIYDTSALVARLSEKRCSMPSRGESRRRCAKIRFLNRRSQGGERMNGGTDTRRVAAITGAAQGIGRRTALLLGERGFALALCDLRACAETLAELRQRDVEALECTGDVCDEAVVARFAAAVSERWGRADVLVNNAGISFIAPTETVSAEDFRRVLEVNLVAPFLLVKAFGAIMLERRSGSIVNVASIAGLTGIADRAAYNASKHGLIGLTRTLASEWGGRGVRCNGGGSRWVHAG